MWSKQARDKSISTRRKTGKVAFTPGELAAAKDRLLGKNQPKKKLGYNPSSGNPFSQSAQRWSKKTGKSSITGI